MLAMMDTWARERGLVIADVVEMAPDAEYVLVPDPSGMAQRIRAVRQRLALQVGIMLLAVTLTVLSAMYGESYWNAFATGVGLATAAYVGLLVGDQVRRLQRLMALPATRRRYVGD